MFIQFQYFINDRWHCIKKTIIEIYNLFLAAKVRIEIFFFDNRMKILQVVFHFGSKKIHIAAAPAINRLLYISYNHRKISAGKELMSKRQQILPLQITRILEFINQEMMITASGFLVTKGVSLR